MNKQYFDAIFNGLTDRRKEVLLKLLANQTDAVIAKSLNIAKSTVRKHRQEICEEFGLKNEFPDERRSKLRELIYLFAKYKPELLGNSCLVSLETSHSPTSLQPEEPEQNKTLSRNIDFLGREGVEDDLDGLVQKARSQFHDKIESDCGNLCMFHVILDEAQSVPIKQICVDDIRVKKSDNRSEMNPSQTATYWKEILQDKARIMLIGQLGAGKTTLLQHIAIQCNDGSFRPDLLPIFVRLKYFVEDIKDLGISSFLDYLSRDYISTQVINERKILLDKLLRSGRALILLDGLDEISQNDINEVLKMMRRFLDYPYNKNPCVISCRKSAEDYNSNLFREFKYLQLEYFGIEQIQEFAKNWFKAIPEISTQKAEEEASNFVKHLERNKRIREFAGIPLLLHLICFVFLETGNFPSKRSQLYDESLSLLIKKWNKFNKFIEIDETQIQELFKLLSQIAVITFELNITSFKLDNIPQLNIVSDDLLKSIEAQYGIVIKQGLKTYSFFHQSIQEYLTAIKFAYYSEQQDLEKLVSYIHDPRWNEVFLLTCEMLPNADNLLQLIKQDIDNRFIIAAQDDKCLYKFLMWLNQKAILAQLSYPLAVVRYLYFELHFSRSSHLLHLRDNNKKEIIILSHTREFSPCFEDFNIPIDYNYLDIGLQLDIKIFFIIDLIKRRKLAATYFPNKIISFDYRQYTSDLNHALDLACYLIVDIELLNALELLKEQIPHVDNSAIILEQWWEIESEKWLNILISITINHRYYIGYDWQFNKKQKEKLLSYHRENELLLKCLNIASSKSEDIYQFIQQYLWISKFPKPEINQEEKRLLDELKDQYIDSLVEDILVKNYNKSEVLTTLIKLAGFLSPPFKLEYENSIEITLNTKDGIINGYIKSILIQQQLWIPIFDSKFTDFLEELATHYTRDYIADKQPTCKSLFIMATDGKKFLFKCVLFKQREQEHDWSNLFSFSPSSNKLYGVLLALKRIGYLIMQS